MYYPSAIKKVGGGAELLSAHLVSLKHHEIEVSNTLLRILAHSLEKGWLTDNIADILVNERVPESCVNRMNPWALS